MQPELLLPHAEAPSTASAEAEQRVWPPYDKQRSRLPPGYRASHAAPRRPPTGTSNAAAATIQTAEFDNHHYGLRHWSLVNNGTAHTVTVVSLSSQPYTLVVICRMAWIIVRCYAY